MTTSNQLSFNLNEIIFAVMVVVMIGVVARIVSKQLTAPKVLPVGPEAEVETEEEKLRAKKASLEAQGRQIAEQAQAGVRFVRLDEDWELPYATIRYWFIDKEGNRIVAADLDELKWKLSEIGKYR